MEVVLKNATQKQVDDLVEQLQEAHAEISDLKAYIMLKESEILFLKERVSNEKMRGELAEKEFAIARKDLECQIESA